MGMCAIRGPRALDDEEIPEEVESSSPRSCTTISTSYSAFGSASSQDLEGIAEAVSRLYEDGAIWQRAIPRGQRCKPLSFAGAIVYDENGHLLTLPLPEDQEMDEYFSPQRNLVATEEVFRSYNQRAPVDHSQPSP